MQVAAALSEHPLPTHAVGEAVGAVLESVGLAPDLACVFVTAGHAGALEDISGAVRSVLRPKVLLGASSGSIVGGHREVEGRPGISVWAARCGGVEPVRIETARVGDGWTIQGLPARAAKGERTLLMVADPHTFPADGFLSQLRGSCPDLSIVGGMVAGVQGPGGARLVVDDLVATDGAVGVLFDPRADVAPLVSHGCRPIGEPFVVTRAERNVVHELGGQPALDRLRTVLESLDPADRATAARGLQVGLVLDERPATFGAGDFLIRNVLGADSGIGAIGLAEPVEVGRTLQFHLRDADTADHDLRAALAGVRADGALLVPCIARGQQLFGYPDHDADVVSSSLEARATAGFFADGEIGPVAGQNHLHAFGASMLLFGPRPG